MNNNEFKSNFDKDSYLVSKTKYKYRIITFGWGSQPHSNGRNPSLSLCMKSWINYIMFSSLWLIADNDVWEVCQTGEHTGLPSAVGPRSDCVHLTNEMSHGEDGATRATKRSLQTNFPPALDCTNSPKFREALVWLANWPHHSEGSFVRGVFGCGATARSGLAQQLCHL